MKLELKHLAPFALYGVKVELFGNIDIVTGLCFENGIVETMNNNNCLVEDVKPILRPLSDLSNEIEHNGEKFYPEEKYLHDFGANDDYLYELQSMDGSYNFEDCKNLPYYACTWLISLHFDVFGLIEKGLAIDKNTL